MQPQQQQQQQPMNANSLQDRARNIVYGFCSIFTMPVEVILRPWYGTRYFDPYIPLFSLVALFTIHGLSQFVSPLGSLLFIAARIQRPHELFDLGSLCRLFFLMLVIHNIRLYRRTIHMHLEKHSQFEGPALFFFQLIPGGKSFWVTRIWLEPLFVIVAAFFMHKLFLFSSALESFLFFSAACLALKNFLVWRVQWEIFRKILDMQYAAAAMAGLVHGQPNEKELEQIHVASFPKDIPSDLRRSAAAYMATIIAPGTTIPEPQGDSHANQ